MKGFFYQDLKRSVMNWGFWAGVLFVSAVLLWAALMDSPLDGSRSYLYGLANIFHASGFSPFAAVFPPLTYATVFCEEYGNGYLRLMLHRSGFGRMIRVRVVTTACSGGLMIALPAALACLAAYTGGIHGVPAGADKGLLEGTKIIAAVAAYGDWYILAGKVMLAFLFGALWALVGLAFAVWIPNRYVGLLAPFILYDTLWLFVGNVSFNPVFLLTGDNVGNGDYPLAALIDMFYIGITIPVIYAGIRKAGRS